MPGSDLGPRGDHAHEVMNRHVHGKGCVVVANVVEEQTAENDVHGTVHCAHDAYPVNSLLAITTLVEPVQIHSSRPGVDGIGSVKTKATHMLGLPVAMFALVVPGVMGTVGKTFGGSNRDHGLGGRHVGVVVHILDTCCLIG